MNILDQFQQLTQEREKLYESITKLALQQYAIDARIVEEIGEPLRGKPWWNEVGTLPCHILYDYTKITEDGDVELYNYAYGHCGYSDEVVDTITLHPTFLNEGVEAYEVFCRAKWNSVVKQKAKAKQAEKASERAQIERELKAVQDRLDKLRET